MSYPVIRKILYASDLGLFGPYILQHVISMAERHQAQVLVVHAVTPMGVFADSVLETYIPDGLKYELRDHGLDEVMQSIREQVIEAFEDELNEGKRGGRQYISDVKVIQGFAADVVLSQASENDVDLIVVGGHSAEADNPMMLGSVANKILQLSEVPVYMVPIMGPIGREGGGPRSGVFQGR